MTAREEREILIKELKRIMNTASNYELRCAYILLLSMTQQQKDRPLLVGLFFMCTFLHIFRKNQIALLYACAGAPERAKACTAVAIKAS